MSTANQVTLDAANKAFRALFTETLELNGEGPLVSALAMKTRSKAKVVEYDWLNSFDELRQWVGERQIANMKAESYTIPNVKYESSISVDRVDVDSDSLGLYAPRVTNMVEQYFRKRRSLIADLLNNGATAGNNSYDGVSFFNANHPSDGNGGTQGNYVTSTTLSGQTFDAAVLTMESLVDHRGQPMDISPDTIVVGPSLRAKARNLFEIRTDFSDSNAGDNPYFGRVKVIVDAYITGNKWYLFDTTKSLKPLILQDADDFELQTLKSVDDDFVVMNDAYFYGTRSRFGVGYGMWQLAYRADQ